MTEEEKQEIAIISEDDIKDKIYTIRGEKVMLDFELAEIYGYTTKRFNEQVKNNIEKFEGFMFQLTTSELDNLARSKKSTPRIWTVGNAGGRTYLPYAFTEQGIYMLMTVLRGELAIKQSRALIMCFKAMKDYFVGNDHLLTTNAIIELNNQVIENTNDIKKLNIRMNRVEKNFDDETTHRIFVIYQGKRIEAIHLYQSIFKQAKTSIVVVDNYLNVNTLLCLKVCNPVVVVTLISDNLSKDKIEEQYLEAFKKDTDVEVNLKANKNRFHDRYIIIDDKTLYISGPSIKDAGNKLGQIIKCSDKKIIKRIIEEIYKE